MSDLANIIRSSGLIAELQPPSQLLQQAVVGQVITPAGDIDPRVKAGLLTPVPLHWYYATIGTGTMVELKQVSRSGRVIRLGAHATTAPTSVPDRLTANGDQLTSFV